MAASDRSIMTRVTVALAARHVGWGLIIALATLWLLLPGFAAAARVYRRFRHNAHVCPRARQF